MPFADALNRWLRFQLELGPDSALRSCLFNQMGEKKAIDFAMKRLQKYHPTLSRGTVQQAVL